MNWESFDWTTLLWIGGIVLLIFFMLRGCGGMMGGGGCVMGGRRQVRGTEDLLAICTSHVERNNLTIRTFMRRFTRLSLGFSKKLDNLAAAVAVHVAYFNYCWRPREKGKSGRLRPTPAMMAGVGDTLWTMDDLYDNVMG